MSEYSGQQLPEMSDFALACLTADFWVQIAGLLLSAFVVFSVLCRFRYAHVKPSWVTLQVLVMGMALWLGYHLAAGQGNARDFLGLGLISLALYMTKHRWIDGPPEIAKGDV